MNHNLVSKDLADKLQKFGIPNPGTGSRANQMWEYIHLGIRRGDDRNPRLRAMLLKQQIEQWIGKKVQVGSDAGIVITVVPLTQEEVEKRPLRNEKNKLNEFAAVVQCQRKNGRLYTTKVQIPELCPLAGESS